MHKNKRKTSSIAGQGKKEKTPVNRKNSFVLLILLITFISFYPSLNAALTNWDDNVYVTENSLIRSLSFDQVKQIFTTPVSLNYHPLTMISLAIDYKISQLNPATYHKTNLLFHLLNTALVSFLIYSVSNKRIEIAAIVSLFFGIHPLHVESVTWVSERKDVLYTFFYLAALITYIKYKEENQRKFYIYTFLLFILSLLSKSVAVTLPVTMLLLDFFMNRKMDRKTLLEKIPFLIVSLALGILAYKIQATEAIAKFETFTVLQRIMFASYGFIMYIVKMVAPYNLSAFYPYPNLDSKGLLPIFFYIAPFIVLAIAAGVYWSLRKTKVIAFGFLFYFITIVLVLQFISVGQVIMADRYTYVPYIGLFFIIAHGLVYLIDRGKIPATPVYLALAAIALLIASITFRRTKVWKDNETLWTDVIHKYPAVETAYENRGVHYAQQNQMDKALNDYQVLVQMDSRNHKIYANLGNIYGLKSQFDKSLWAYSKSIELKPQGNLEAFVNRGVTYSLMKQYEKAIPDYSTAISLSPDAAPLYNKRGYTYFMLGENKKALEDYNRLLELNPSDTGAFFNRGLAKFNLGLYREAMHDFSTFVRLRPNAEGYYNCSVTCSKLQDHASALENALKAKNLGYPINQQYIDDLKKKAGEKNKS